ncbi:Major facilitator superfamily domain containing protein [Rhypophila decipiens]
MEQFEVEEPHSAFHRVYLTGAKLMVVLGCLIVGTFLLMLDTSVIATAAPSIINDFKSLPDLGWYSSVYQLACAAIQPLTGKIFQRFPLKSTYLAFFLVFMLGSVLCATAISSKMFIIGRAVAGLGGAGITTGALTITSTIASPQRANELVGIVMAFSHLGMVMGPIVGGIFSQYVTWRWCFMINIPLGALIIPVLLLISIPEQVEKAPPLQVFKKLHQQLDLVGFALFTPATVQLLLALQYGASGEHAWNSAVVIGLFCGSGGSLIAWAIWTHIRGKDAIIPMYILKPRVVWAAVLTQCLIMSSIYMTTIFLSIYFQAVLNASPIESGLDLLAGVVSQLFFTIVTGRMVVKTGLVSYFAATAGLFTVGSAVAFTFLGVSSQPVEYIGYQVLGGVGRGAGMQSQITAINFSLGPADNAVAMAVLMFAQFLFTAIMQVVANVVFLESLRAGLASRLPQADAATIIAAGASSFRDVVSAQELPVVLEVYLGGIGNVFWMVCGIGGLVVLTGLMMGRVKPPQGG